MSPILYSGLLQKILFLKKALLFSRANREERWTRKHSFLRRQEVRKLRLRMAKFFFLRSHSKKVGET